VRALIPRLPDSFNPNRGDEIPANLIGATIVALGTTPDEHIEGGGLILDYRPQKADRVCRLVLAFNELGMWIHRKAILDAGRESDF